MKKQIGLVEIIIALIMLFVLLLQIWMGFLPLALAGMFRNPIVTTIWIIGALFYWKFCFEPILDFLRGGKENDWFG